MVIARFSKLKAGSLSIGGIAIIPLLVAATLYHPRGTSLIDYIESRGEFWLVALPVGWLGLAAALLLFLAILYQLIFAQGKAVWIDGSTIIFLNSWFRAIRQNDIKNVTAVRLGFWKLPAIVLTLRSGKIKSIPTGLLEEPTEVVLSRIHDQCHGVTRSDSSES